MANKNRSAKLNDPNGGTVGSLQTVRIPFYYPLDSRSSGAIQTNADNFFQNVYLEEVKDSHSGYQKFRAIKRSGIKNILSTFLPSGTSYGTYYWNGFFYHIIDGTIYTVDLTAGTINSLASGLNPSSTPKICTFAETHPDSVTPYLAVNDGSQLYLIDKTNKVTILNNVVINTSSVAGATVITTATPHKLTTGNKVVIKNHTGSTPSINNTSYTVTVLNSTQFTIPVTVTVAGTGGTIGVFPTNVGDIEFMNGYLFVGNSQGRVYNCDFNDATSWQTTSYITCQMQSDLLVGLGRQNNFIVVFKERTTQFFYDSGNSIVGATPLANSEQSMQQIGCSGGLSISSTANTVYWVGNAKTGGFTIYKLDGTTNIKDIGSGAVSRILQNEANNLVLSSGIATCLGILISNSGHTFYMLTLNSINSVLIYNETSETWTLWTLGDINGNPIVSWPLFWTQVTNTTVGSKLYCTKYNLTGSVNYYNFDPTYGVDDVTGNSPVCALSTNAITLDTGKRKYWERAEIIGDNWGSSGTVQLSYSDIDQDPNSFPTSSRSWSIPTATIDRKFSTRSLGNSRRRAWGVTHFGPAAGTRFDALEFDIRISEF
jgi:hypothetical protein